MQGSLQRMGERMTTARRMVLEGERDGSWNKWTRSHHHATAKEKKRVKNLVRSWIQNNDPHCKPFDVPVTVTVTVYYDSKPHDSCNIPAKFYTDGMLAVGESHADGWRSWLWDDDMEWVVSTTTIPKMDADNPRVEILLEPVEEVEE